MFWDTVGSSHGRGPLPLREDAFAMRCVIPRFMCYTATSIWDGSNGSPVLSLEKAQSFS